MIFVLIFLLQLINNQYYKVNANQHLTYSFPLPQVLGEGTYKNSNCCDLVPVPANDTENIENKKYPSFVGLGVKKSGTSTFFYLLKNHPNFVGSHRKEITYLARDNSTLSINDYLSYWDLNNYENIETLHLYEVTSNYLWAPLAACRAKYFFPEMKFVVILRDQITRTWSHFNFEVKWCVINNNPVDQCIKKQKFNNYTDVIINGIRKLKQKQCDFNSGIPYKSWNDCYKCVTLLGPMIKHKCGNWNYYTKKENNEEICFPFDEELISIGMYSAQVAWWFNFFKPHQFYFLNKEIFEENSVRELQHILDFVGEEKPFLNSYIKRNRTLYNGGAYYFEISNYQRAYDHLYDFFLRPNKELVQLLHSTGHIYFKQFRLFEDVQFRIDSDSTLKQKDIKHVNLYYFNILLLLAVVVRASYKLVFV